jgi:hypothetical protein
VLTGIIGARRVWTVSMMALDDYERDAFASHFDVMGVS